MKFAVIKESLCVWSFTKLYDTQDEARVEAERLCRKENATFYVVRLVEKCYIEKHPVLWTSVK